MNKIQRKCVTLALLLATALSSLAAQNTAAVPPLPLSDNRLAPTAPSWLTVKVALDPADLMKYQQLAAQSKALANGKAAGAVNNTKTFLIVVGVVVVIGIIVAASSSHVGDINFSNPQ